MPRHRLPLWRIIKWEALAPEGEVPHDCLWTRRQVLAALIEAGKAGERTGPGEWCSTYLRSFPGVLQVLLTYIETIIEGGDFTARCRRRGWSRATAYRFIGRGVAIIALGLARDRIAVPPGWKVAEFPTRCAGHDRKTSHATNRLDHSIVPVVA